MLGVGRVRAATTGVGGAAGLLASLSTGGATWQGEEGQKQSPHFPLQGFIFSLPPSLSLYLMSEGLRDNGSRHLVLPGPAFLPLLHHFSSVHQQVGLPLAKRQVLVDGGDLVLAVAAGFFFALDVLEDGDGLLRPAGARREKEGEISAPFY